MSSALARNLDLPRRRIREFCTRWKVTELAVFGSVLREDFGPESDVDVLVAFAPDVRWTLLAHVEMQDELASILGRNVDLVSLSGIRRSRNHIRRQEILGSAEVVYAAS